MNVLYISSMLPKYDETIYTDLAEILRDRGHNITVIATLDWLKDEKGGLCKERGMDFIRVKTMPMYNVGYIKKGLAFITLKYFFIHSINKYLKDKNFTFILFESPPITMYSIIHFAKKHFRCPTYLMLKDIFPQNALDLKILSKASLLYSYFRHVEKRLYQTTSFIGCMSEANRRYILKHNLEIPENKVELFPNTKKIKDYYAIVDKIARKKLGIEDDICVFLFGGNIGKPQYIELLCEVVQKCKSDKNLFFLAVGRGSERIKLHETIDKYNISNAKLIENMPREEYEQLTRECDAGLVILAPQFTVPNYPSRILSYMEVGIPVIAATDDNTDVRMLIEDSNCGYWCSSKDVDEFIECVRKLAGSTELRKRMGYSGRIYLERHFDVIHSAEILENHFKM